MESCWFSFKNRKGIPFMFYNSETGEHRWPNEYQFIQCSRANLEEIPPIGQCNRNYIKVPGKGDIEKEGFSSSKKTYKDAMTNTDNLSCGKEIQNTQPAYSSHVITRTEFPTHNEEAEVSLTLDAKKESCVKNPADSFSMHNQPEYTPLKLNSPPRNPFSVDEDEVTDQDYTETKESLVHNLFSMELSSVLTEEDLQRNQSCTTSEYKTDKTPLSSFSDSDNSEKEMAGPQISNLKRNEKYLTMEKLGTERDVNSESEQPETTVLMNIKKEQHFNELEMSSSPLIKLEHPDDTDTEYIDTEYSIADLLPSNQAEHITPNKTRRFKCHKCSARFRRVSDVRRHMFTHEDSRKKPRPYACSLCSKSFVEANCLKKHMRTHTGEKPYCCPICGKAFSQSQNLNKHKNIHTGNRPHKCEECGKAFVQHSHLARHKLIHSGEKPFQCKQCPKRYRTRSHLIRHFKSSKHKDIASVDEE